MNPDRHCGMCTVSNMPQKPINELLELLSPIVVLTSDDEYGTSHSLRGDMNAALLMLVEATENCPACILAALRQKGIPIPLTKFSFSEACNKFWGLVNEGNRETEVEALHRMYDY